LKRRDREIKMVHDRMQKKEEQQQEACGDLVPILTNYFSHFLPGAHIKKLLHTSSVCKEKEVVDLVKSIEDPAAK
jgi:hypothetical protein